MSKLVDIKSTLYAAMAVAVLAMALVLPTQAVAETECADAGSDPTAAQYCTSIEIDTGSESESSSESESYSEAESSSEAEASAESVAGASSGSLPFTGADLLVLAAVAAAFVAIGLALQRLSRAKTDPR